MAFFLFLLLVFFALLPLILRIGKFLLIVHTWLVVVFLPAGLLMHYGPSQDMRLFVAVTCGWSLTLIAYGVRARLGRAGRLRRQPITRHRLLGAWVGGREHAPFPPPSVPHPKSRTKNPDGRLGGDKISAYNGRAETAHGPCPHANPVRCEK